MARSWTGAAPGEAPRPPPDPRLAALVPYARGEKPVIFHADHRTEILDALAIAEGPEAQGGHLGRRPRRGTWPSALKEAGVPVLVGGTLNLPAHEHDPYDARLCQPGAAARGGGDGRDHARRAAARPAATDGRNLPYEAATAIAFGLPEDAALKAVTLTPAQILGVADQVGSLEAGKRANLVVTAGHILQPTTPVLALFMDGKPVMPESRHTRLYDKYLSPAPRGRSRASLLWAWSAPPRPQARVPRRAAASSGAGGPETT